MALYFSGIMTSPFNLSASTLFLVRVTVPALAVSAGRVVSHTIQVGAPPSLEVEQRGQTHEARDEPDAGVGSIKTRS